MNILVISSYPKQHSVHARGVVGVATYTKQLLTAVKSLAAASTITVFAEREKGKKTYKEDGISVHRTWKRGDILSTISLYKDAYMHPAEIVLLSFEAYMLGSFVHIAIALLGMLILKLRGKKNYILLHQVVADFSALETNVVKAKVLNVCKTVLYKSFLLVSDKLFVFEKELADTIGKSAKKVIVLPHLIPDVQPVDQETARKKLGLAHDAYYVLYFGFLAPYKGIKWLIQAWQPQKDMHLLVCGGLNPNHKKNKKIGSYTNTVMQLAQEKNIQTTGFVREEDLALYFSAANSVILPYKAFFSSSGPLSLAFAFGKPVLLSRALAGYKKSKDIQSALKSTGTSMSDMVFDFSKEDLRAKIIQTKRQEKKRQQFAQEVKTLRSPQRIAALFVEQLSLASVRLVSKGGAYAR